MKKYIALIMVLIAGATFWNLKEEKKSLPEVKTADIKSPTRLSLKKSKYIIPGSAPMLETFPKECQSSLKDLAALTMDEYQDFVKSEENLENFFGLDCLKLLKRNAVFQKLQKSAGCLTFNEKACMTMMFMLKAQFIADHTKGKNLEMMTSQELASHFVKMFSELDQLNKESFRENLKMLDHFFEMHSQDPDVQEAYLGYLMIGQKITNDDSVGGKINELLEENFGSSFKLDRLHVINDILSDNLSSAEKKLSKLGDLYPDEPDLAYYQAAFHWKQGNVALANTYLEKAIKLGEGCASCPQDSYAETKRRVASAKKGDNNFFSVSIGLNFENL